RYKHHIPGLSNYPASRGAIKVVGHRLRSIPEGTTKNSRSYQRWGQPQPSVLVPKGWLRSIVRRAQGQSSLWDSCLSVLPPKVETLGWAIIEMSLRDKDSAV